MILVPILIFVLGLIVGSFLNVVILRLNTGRSIVRGRSACARCSRTLAWYELVPVFSFLALRGKCRTCAQSISFQYPLVELTTAILFVIEYSRIVVAGGFTGVAWISYAFTLAVTALFVVIFVYDLRHKIIPDQVVYPLILLSLVSIVWQAVTVPYTSIITALFGGVAVALPFFCLWFFSKGRLMGFGDVKLALAIGWLMGLGKGYMVFLFSFWIGGIVGLLLIGLSRKYQLKSQVPFAPFLIIAVCIVGLFGVTLAPLVPLW